MALAERLAARRLGRLTRFGQELSRFGLVGVLGMVVDLGGFNLLWYGADGEGPLHDKPLTARATSIVAATLVTYLGNRHWTWRHGPRRGFHREYTLFFVLNAVGLAVNLGVLAFVNYALGLRDDALANNLANLAGIACGTAFRFWSYRRFVFRAARGGAGPAGVGPGGAGPVRRAQ